MVEIAHTTFKAAIWPRLTRVHRRQKIGVFAGPPGLGKTTVARHFLEEHPGQALLVTVPHGSASGVRGAAAVQLLLEALYEANHWSSHSSYLSSLVEARMRLHGVLCGWEQRYGSLLTIVMDEAQNLSEEAIEAIRYLNDDRSGYSPFRIGLIFIGNATFRLKGDKRGCSIMTDAVVDRALYADVFAYEDITDADLSLIMDARGVIDPECHRLVVRYFKSGLVKRSYRQLGNLLDNLSEEAGGAAVTASTFKTVVGL